MTGLDVALALLDPVALAAALALWLPAALLVGHVQDDPAGPAPRARRVVAARLAGVLVLAGGLAALQTLAAVLVLVAGAGDRVADPSWPALAALVTAATGVALRTAPPLARQLRGRPVRDAARWARSLAAVRAGAPAGGLAVLLAVAAPTSPQPVAAGPTVLPVVLAAGSVLVARRVLHTAALARSPGPRPVPVAPRPPVPVPRTAERAVVRRVPPSPACASTTSPTLPRPTA